MLQLKIKCLVAYEKKDDLSEIFALLATLIILIMSNKLSIYLDYIGWQIMTIVFPVFSIKNDEIVFQ